MKRKLEKINKLLKEQFGIPVRAAVPPDPVDLIIATILSQNTNDKNSYKAFRSLKKRFGDWMMVHRLETAKLEDIIKVAGLARQKAAAIKELLNHLVATRGRITLNHLEKITDEKVLEELTKIRGIGIKTASCVLLFSMERNVCPVDTHVHRTLNRIGAVKTTSPVKTFEAISGKIPEGLAHQFHTNLIRLGREICRSAAPVCYQCPLRKICSYPHKDMSRKQKARENNFFLLDNVNSPVVPDKI